MRPREPAVKLRPQAPAPSQAPLLRRKARVA
jgi:hypothetical protein